jgi:D-threo-aldose 1-dehydrogenase
MTRFADSTLERRRLGSTSIVVGVLGFGGATIGGIGGIVSEAQAHATLEAAWDGGLRYFDTAPWYGRGLSELRVGRLLREKPRDEFVISTKVGRILRTPADLATFDRSPWPGGGPFEVQFDYTYDGILRAYEDSLQRLGLARIDLAIVHDLDLGYHTPQARWDALMAQLITGGWRALDELRSAGIIGGIGVGINPRGMIPRFVELFDPDFFLVAGRYTLMEQDIVADELPMLVERGIGVVIGAVFGSGLLATGPVAGARYSYRSPTSDEIDKVTRIRSVCDRHGVPLVAAALQFPLGHPAVASVIPGPNSPEQVQSNLEGIHYPVPADLWRELQHERLVRQDAPVPAGEVAVAH